MAIVTRAARRDEFDAVRGIIARAFPTHDEARLWDALVAHDPALTPECVRVATIDTHPVACVVALPREIRARGGLVPGAIVTLVACEPDRQRQGYGSAAMRDALAWMAARGLALGVLYGHPTYYPRFGFVPVLPSWQTDLSVGPDDAPITPPGASGQDSTFQPIRELPTAPVPAIALLPATDEHTPDLARLYAATIGPYPCAVARGTDAWLWRPRDADQHQVLVLADRAGYAFVSPDAEESTLTVHEAAAGDTSTACRLLTALQREGHDRGLAHLRLTLPPDHILARLARLASASQIYRPATAGMAVITRWDRLLPPRYQVDDEGIRFGWIRVLRANRRHLTELALGYHGVDDLLLTPECALPDGDGAAHLTQLRDDFPPLFPHWSLAPFWF